MFWTLFWLELPISSNMFFSTKIWPIKLKKKPHKLRNSKNSFQFYQKWIEFDRRNFFFDFNSNFYSVKKMQMEENIMNIMWDDFSPIHPPLPANQVETKMSSFADKSWPTDKWLLAMWVESQMCQMRWHAAKTATDLKDISGPFKYLHSGPSIGIVIRIIIIIIDGLGSTISFNEIICIIALSIVLKVK